MGQIFVWEYKEGVSGLSLPKYNGETLQAKDVLVRWGTSASPAPGEHEAWVLNPRPSIRRAIDKPTMLRILKAAKVPVPSVIHEGLCVVKRRTHFGGKGCRILGPSTYVETYEPADREYRVYVAVEGTLIRLKVYDGEDVPPRIRSHSRGYRFVIPSDPVPPEVDYVARQAVNALGLHIGTVDVGYSDTKGPIVYEVNSGPRITTDAIKAWVTKKILAYHEAMMRAYDSQFTDETAPWA